ncbi:MAG: 3'(2'),5'-bisphosphate nucleotidase CysQ [Erysipelothrix sp.]|jgi:3'(2'), 5'-bisphosphate nucleotidase|nr:3'(2'),5'-bisphosphate nucleotidase CysQ [Erysipelothrix sp.]
MHLNQFEPLKQLMFDAGEEILKIYHQDFEVMMKEDLSPLTQADLKANRMIHSFCNEHFPDIDFLSEEASFKHDHSKPLAFICDPLDGTKEFVAKNGEFTVNLALLENGRPILGLIYAPVSKTLFYAQKDQGAYMQISGQPTRQIKTTTKSNDLKAVISRSHLGEKEQAFLDKNKASIIHTTKVGSSLKGCVIASGFADVYVRYGPTSEWDIAAMDIIVHEAGGVLNDINHQPLIYRKANPLNPHFYVLNTKENIWLI